MHKGKVASGNMSVDKFTDSTPGFCIVLMRGNMSDVMEVYTTSFFRVELRTSECSNTLNRKRRKYVWSYMYMQANKISFVQIRMWPEDELLKVEIRVYRRVSHKTLLAI